MKRFLIALALSSLAVFGSANAALLNFFTFGDESIETSFVFSGDTPVAVILFFQNPTLDTGLNPTALVTGLTVDWPEKVIAGNLIYTASSGDVDFVSFSNTPDATGSLPGGAFALGLNVGGTRVALTSIASAGSPGAYSFLFGDGAYSVLVDDLIAVPIPAAALLFLSGIGGLLLVARRNSSRNRKENRVDEPLVA